MYGTASVLPEKNAVSVFSSFQTKFAIADFTIFRNDEVFRLAQKSRKARQIGIGNNDASLSLAALTAFLACENAFSSQFSTLPARS